MILQGISPQTVKGLKDKITGFILVKRVTVGVGWRKLCEKKGGQWSLDIEVRSEYFVVK